MVADYLESGNAGPVVVLVHSSVSGARQWRRLMDDLKGRFHLRAVNLFGYGKTPAWPNHTMQSLDDQAMLVESVLPGWIHRCGPECAAAWNQELAPSLGIRAAED